jgi:hypothetical protein
MGPEVIGDPLLHAGVDRQVSLDGVGRGITTTAVYRAGPGDAAVSASSSSFSFLS